jgi:hypothetical protein
MSDAEIEKVKYEILHYLKNHPEASDDLEGITRFWVTRERIEAAIETVQQAIDGLVKEGLLKKEIYKGVAGVTKTTHFRLSAMDKRAP